jgi:hypothetical protein
MLEIKAEPTRRNSGFQGMNTAVAKGVFMYNAGVFGAAHIPPSTSGKAHLGDSPRMLTADDILHSGFGVYPVTKYIRQTEGADQSLDTIASGEMLLFFEGGEFETDEYDVTVSGTGTLPGAKLHLNATGQITLTAKAGWSMNPIGEVVYVSDYPESSMWYNGGTAGVLKKTVRYKLYASHSAPVFNSQGG